MIPNPESLCIDPRVDPLLGELTQSVSMRRAGPDSPARLELEAFVRTVFFQACGARVSRFLSELLGFEREGRLTAVVGIARAAEGPLFVEQYLDETAEESIARQIGGAVQRADVVEVGNLALGMPGQARWIIAATTAFLAASGYRWVIFTAAAPLSNAFRRLGLRPIPLVAADPRRLPDGGASWGSYYDAAPTVYAGDVTAGLDKLRQARCWQKGHPRDLLGQARSLGLAPWGVSRTAGRAGA